MPIRFVKWSKFAGITLVEILIATGLGGLVISTLTLFVVNLSTTMNKEIARLLLHSTVSEALRFIQDDIRRAQAISVTTSPTQITYFYQRGDSYIYRIIKADFSEKKLKYCSEKLMQQVTDFKCSVTYSMFDENQFNLRELLIEKESAAGQTVISLEITVELKKPLPQHSLRLSVQVAPRDMRFEE